MKTKKQLDRLFKEQFRNMEVAPPQAVWENISAALQKKKQSKRVVPLWYKLAGVAAALLVFFSVGSLFFNPTGLTEITSEDTIPQNDTEISSPATPQFVGSEETNAIVQGSSEPTLSDDSDTKNLKEKEQKTLSPISEEAISQTDLPKKQKQTEKSTSEIAVQQSPKFIDPRFPKDELKTEDPPVKTDIAQNIISDQTPPEQDVTETKRIKEEENTIAQSEIKEENKTSLIDYIAEKNEKALTVSNPVPFNRWEVAPNVAPVYYSSLGNGSSIDAQFSENSKSGDVNLSYGVKVSYAINEKLSIRTGINKVDLSYSTNDIEFAIASANEGLQSINSKGKGYTVAVGTRGSLQPSSSNLPTITEDGTVIVPRNGVIPGTMLQELDYFEIPLELKYSLLNKKFGVNLVGGLSTLFLNNNQVSVSSDGFQTEIGSANNLNDVSFSTNVGLGFDYKLSNRFVFNLEPMFKYQLNPYSDSSIDFKPYYLGVYSGFSYRF